MGSYTKSKQASTKQADYRQFENENERLLTSRKDPPEYGASKAHQSVQVGQHIQQPTQSQTVVRVPNSIPNINDYFGLALFVTLCCCLPFGIVALIKSSEVRDKAASGDQQGALEASESAKMWSCTGLTCGLIQSAITVVVLLVLANNGYFTNSDNYYH